ncbi:MAG: ABC transporter ATP-binding protein [Desulfatiglandaceae bacterium]
MLKIEGLNAFYGDVHVLFDVSLTVTEGEKVSIVGSNAAGKTTLLLSLAGLLKKKSGVITFDGHQLQTMPPNEIVNLGIIHIPQGRRVFPLLSVQENLEIGAFSQRSRLNIKKLLAENYEFFPKLYEVKRQPAGSLSGGEQQMLAIARGLMARPRLLTVDEPSLGLSPILVEKTFEILEKINREKVTILLVEQNVVKALNMSHRAYVIENGKMVLQGQGAELLKNEHLKTAYLGM